jgi:hypothetical protein
MGIVGFEPCFRVLDVDRAVADYQRLGFNTDYHDETYAFAHRDHLTIHLAHDAYLSGTHCGAIPGSSRADRDPDPIGRRRRRA